MRIPLFFIVIASILAEIAMFILVGKAIGVLATLTLILLGMAAGALLLRNRGIATLLRIRADSAAGRFPARHLAEGAVLVIAALLIMLPGFISDVVGLALFIPAVRAALLRGVRRHVGLRPTAAERRKADGAVVELERGEYTSDARADSPWRRNGASRA